MPASDGSFEIARRALVDEIESGSVLSGVTFASSPFGVLGTSGLATDREECMSSISSSSSLVNSFSVMMIHKSIFFEVLLKS
mmetsp:Transcript_16329/g.31701  ORF Transcript_16329/g.31701 Transcript_16329/m.31701 type:complete len:82 (+) Transcript_16329:429-674(+)